MTRQPTIRKRPALPPKMTSEELRSIMTTCGWSQPDLARLLPLKSTRTIRYWLSGERTIRPLVAARIRQLAGK